MENPMFKRLLEHTGHRIACVTYGDAENPANVAVECEDCGIVLVDESPEVDSED